MKGMKGIDELDHYELLEIPRNATTGEVERAYRDRQADLRRWILASTAFSRKREASAIRDLVDEAWVVLNPSCAPATTSSCRRSWRRRSGASSR
ncbi:MAG: J domain-containing protein [Myxococcota bacterium]